MKMYVTGHTSGIGRAFCCYYHAHDVVGLSRRTGHDLSKNISDFVKNDFDVYVNNAYYNYAQVDLLYDLFDANRHRECIIVNLSSVSSIGNKDTVNRYAVHKSALDKACLQLQLVDTDCRVMNINLGRTDTPMTDHRSEYPRLDTIGVVKIIDYLISLPADIFVKNITIDILHSRNKINQ